MKTIIFGTGKMSRALKTALEPRHTVVVVGRDRIDASSPVSLRDILEAEKPDLVCNTVVLGGIDACEDAPALAHSINTNFPRHLAAYSGEMGFHLLHISSDAVFGNAAPGMFYDEHSLPSPLNAYGLTKFGADAIIPELTDRYHIIRLPLLFGPCDKAHQFFEKMLKLGLQRGALSISDDMFSSAAYSLDVAERAIRLVDENTESGLYHVAGETVCSLYELLDRAVQVLGLPISIKPVSHTAFPSTALKSVNTPLRSIKIQPLRPWQESVVEYCESTALIETIAEWSSNT